ncbi:enoyl-CoA hydratase/carnithine racemase [Novosphingobium sp. SG751A]|uniref:enoyl-CoA hydratase/isomerase family protein n=1 Tax=Novosphingobium sp. SG751A TaxID=2587000 RepID=UPI001C129B48|nr:enoyl-CoA hydratase/isomerase family protein [Novosphingobium sp. SG751A]NOW48562.1 enoyl-CoA hydratase/carnithine racemase [Novosphingobium sp. SG751A]
MRMPIRAALLLSTVLLYGGTPAQASAPALQATSAATPAAKTIITVKTISPEVREISYANPPLNFIVPETLVALNQAVLDLSKDDRVKVVLFTSAVDGFFYNHFDMGQFPGFIRQVSATGKPLWVELISNIEKAPFLTVASIRGRAQGGGDELMLAFDLRYASKEKAIFNQPEVGIGLFPGGGGPDHLVRLAGRDRALEAFLSADDYDASTAERFGWVTRTLPDAELDEFVAKQAMRLATFDKTALIETKKHINAIALPTEAERLEAYHQFTKSVTWPGLQQRMGVFGKVIQDAGPMNVETRMGYYVGEGNRQIQESGRK